MNIDYYNVLGIERTAGAAAVKKAYRSLAMKYHPDRNQGDDLAEEKFKLVNEAYATVGDSEKRQAYDLRLRQQAAASKRRETNPPQFDDFYLPDDEVLREFYEGFYFRQQARHGRARRGQDLRQNLKIGFSVAALGGDAEIHVPVFGQCPQCRGAGVKAGSKMIVCQQCRGRGQKQDRHGFFQPCPACGGKGKIPTALCARCKGKGETWSEQPVTIRIPAGVETGARLQVRGMGLKGGAEGFAGDFIIVVHVEKHPFFERKGLDIICEVPVSVYGALLGGALTVPGLDGLTKIKIKSGMKDNSEIRLPGRGARSEKSGKCGDMVYRLHIEMPKKIPASERKLLQQLAGRAPGSFPLAVAFRKKMQKHG
jgi:molecular chaperone DnaJ